MDWYGGWAIDGLVRRLGNRWIGMDYGGGRNRRIDMEAGGIEGLIWRRGE